jgi:hypothetical protein
MKLRGQLSPSRFHIRLFRKTSQSIEVPHKAFQENLTVRRVSTLPAPAVAASPRSVSSEWVSTYHVPRSEKSNKKVL